MTFPGSKKPGIKTNEGMFQIPQNSRNEAKPLNAGQCHTLDTCWEQGLISQ